MNPLVRLTHRYQSLRESEKKVADYIQRHAPDIVLMPLHVLAAETGTSDATVLRLCRSLGFSGYQDFKSALIPELLSGGAPVHQHLKEGDGFSSRLEVFACNLSQNLSATLNNLQEDAIHQVVTSIVQSNLIVVIGLAGSAGVGRIFVDSLLSVGKLALYLADRVEIERTTASMRRDQLLFAISHSGETEEVCRAIERAQEQRVFCIGVTNFSPSRVEALADVTLLTATSENLLGSYSCTPRIGQLALLELIVTDVAEKMRRERRVELVEG